LPEGQIARHLGWSRVKPESPIRKPFDDLPDCADKFDLLFVRKVEAVDVTQIFFDIRKHGAAKPFIDNATSSIPRRPETRP
jgi:hypothetical protein